MFDRRIGPVRHVPAQTETVQEMDTPGMAAQLGVWMDRPVQWGAVRPLVAAVVQELRSNSDRGTPDYRMIDSSVPMRNSG